MGYASQRQIVCFESVLKYQLLCTEHGTEVSAYKFINRAFTYIALSIFILIPEAEARTGNDGKILRRTRLLESIVYSLVKFYRILYTNERINADTVSVLYNTDRFSRSHNLIHDLPPIRQEPCKHMYRLLKISR